MLLKMLRSLFQDSAGKFASAEKIRDAAQPRAAQRMPLTRAGKTSGACKICGGPAALFDVVDLNKHCAEGDPYQFGLSGIPVYYERCTVCSFVFTRHFDDWDADRFAEVIYNDDYSKVDGDYSHVRPLATAGYFAENFAHAADLAILDYGAGSGVFAGRMKELGFAGVTAYDPFSHPHRPAGPFDVITCVEVLEHAPEPHETLRDLLSFGHADTIVLFTTQVQPDDIERRRGAWWYIGPRNGHISIYTDAALDALAEAHGLYYFPGEGAFMAFCRRPDPQRIRVGVAYPRKS